MSPQNRYALMVEALIELASEIQANHTLAQSTLPYLQDVLAHLGPLPPEALFIGIATDELPLLLNLRDPAPGPILIVADAGAGKTHFLQALARGAEELHPPERLQYGVVTHHPEEWENFGHSPLQIGIFPAYHNSSQDFLLSLAAWAYSSQHKQSNLLLIDGLESLLKLDFEARQAFRWLLLRGPARNVWPIITVNAEAIQEKSHWLELFKTRFIGLIKNEQVAHLVTGNRPAPLATLERHHFLMLENEHWLKFWIPSLK